MSTELPGTPRAGKYCPRCQTMTQREQPVCLRCGHQFRTGAEKPLAATPAPDAVNRTMQFVLPPLPGRLPEPREGAGLPPPAPLPPASRAAPPRLLVPAAVFLVLLACLGGAWLWHSRPSLPPETTPAGTWETTLHGSESANARLEFTFAAGGTGQFSWQESGPKTHSGQTPLHWNQNPDGTLALTLTPSAGGDSVSQALTGIFSRPAWPWRVDRAQHQLVLGTLVFTEKP